MDSSCVLVYLLCQDSYNVELNSIIDSLYFERRSSAREKLAVLQARMRILKEPLPSPTGGEAGRVSARRSTHSAMCLVLIVLYYHRVIIVICHVFNDVC